MNPQRYSVVQWATGDCGTRTMREVIRHPTLDLVGVLVYDPAKDGVDAGKLCGEDSVGVTATTDRGAVLALAADCVVYTPRATGSGSSRAGLSLAEVIDDVVALLEAGTNIVTICTDFHAGGAPVSARRGGTAFSPHANAVTPRCTRRAATRDS